MCIAGGSLGLLTGMRVITFLELVFWFMKFFSRICFKVKGIENAHNQKESLTMKQKKTLFMNGKRNKKNSIQVFIVH